MGFAIPLLTLGSGATQAIGQYQQGHAAAQAAKYNAAMAEQNAKIQDQNAVIAGQAGAAQVGMQQRQTRAMVGDTVANEGASGVDVNSGSSTNVVGSESSLGMLDALTVRSNATKEAYGYTTQAANERAEGELDKYKAKKTEQGALWGAAGTLLGSASQAGGQFMKYKQAGGFG